MIIILILIIIAVIFLILKIAFKKETKKANLPYKANLYFLNPGEQIIYKTLKLIFKDEVIIFSKTRLIDLLQINTKGKDYWHHRGKVIQKHVDFIICEPKNFKVKLAIELDGIQHKEPEQKEKDNFKDEVLKTIGIPLLRIKAKQSYNLSELKEQIEKTLIQDIEPIK